jgi:quercetin dioxygenase-like cupin family protein
MNAKPFLTKQKFPVPVDKAGVARHWNHQGYSCDGFTDPPGREWNDFVHSCNELVTVVEGRLELKISDTTYIAEPSDEVFIPRGALHSVKNVNTHTTR